MELKPVNQKLLIKRQEKTDMTSGGIVMPSASNKEVPAFGEIIAVADDCENKNFQKGLTVHFHKFEGNDVGEFTLIDESKILCIEL